MAVHVFDKNDPEVHAWTDVLPGDLVHSPGTTAWTGPEMDEVHELNCRRLTLGHGLLTVISRSAPDKDDEIVAGIVGGDCLTTFMVLSRHGLLYMLQRSKRKHA